MTEFLYSKAVSQRCSIRKDILRNSAKFTGKHSADWPAVSTKLAVKTSKSVK